MIGEHDRDIKTAQGSHGYLLEPIENGAGRARGNDGADGLVDGDDAGRHGLGWSAGDFAGVDALNEIGARRRRGEGQRAHQASAGTNHAAKHGRGQDGRNQRRSS